MPTLEPWSVVDVTNWPVAGDEPRGLRAKCWLFDPWGTQWLRKDSIRRPRQGRLQPREKKFEPTIEALVLRLASACGLSAAVGHPCRWDDVLRPDAKGIVVRVFTKPGSTEELSGRQLIQSR